MIGISMLGSAIPGRSPGTSHWRIQLNMRSVGEKDHLVSARINPNGDIALSRIEMGMGWQLTNSFDF